MRRQPAVVPVMAPTGEMRRVIHDLRGSPIAFHTGPTQFLLAYNDKEAGVVRILKKRHDEPTSLSEPITEHATCENDFQYHSSFPLKDGSTTVISAISWCLGDGGYFAGPQLIGNVESGEAQKGCELQNVLIHNQHVAEEPPLPRLFVGLPDATVTMYGFERKASNVRDLHQSTPWISLFVVPLPSPTSFIRASMAADGNVIMAAVSKDESSLSLWISEYDRLKAQHKAPRLGWTRGFALQDGKTNLLVDMTASGRFIAAARNLSPIVKVWSRHGRYDSHVSSWDMCHLAQGNGVKEISWLQTEAEAEDHIQLVGEQCIRRPAVLLVLQSDGDIRIWKQAHATGLLLLFEPPVILRSTRPLQTLQITCNGVAASKGAVLRAGWVGQHGFRHNFTVGNGASGIFGTSNLRTDAGIDRAHPRAGFQRGPRNFLRDILSRVLTSSSVGSCDAYSRLARDTEIPPPRVKPLDPVITLYSSIDNQEIASQIVPNMVGASYGAPHLSTQSLQTESTMSDMSKGNAQDAQREQYLYVVSSHGTLEIYSIENVLTWGMHPVRLRLASAAEMPVELDRRHHSSLRIHGAVYQESATGLQQFEFIAQDLRGAFRKLAKVLHSGNVRKEVENGWLQECKRIFGQSECLFESLPSGPAGDLEGCHKRPVTRVDSHGAEVLNKFGMRALSVISSRSQAGQVPEQSDHTSSIVENKSGRTADDPAILRARHGAPYHEEVEYHSRSYGPFLMLMPRTKPPTLMRQEVVPGDYASPTLQVVTGIEHSSPICDCDWDQNGLLAFGITKDCDVFVYATSLPTASFRRQPRATQATVLLQMSLQADPLLDEEVPQIESPLGAALSQRPLICAMDAPSWPTNSDENAESRHHRSSLLVVDVSRTRILNVMVEYELKETSQESGEGIPNVQFAPTTSKTLTEGVKRCKVDLKCGVKLTCKLHPTVRRIEHGKIICIQTLRNADRRDMVAVGFCGGVVEIWALQYGDAAVATSRSHPKVAPLFSLRTVAGIGPIFEINSEPCGLMIVTARAQGSRCHNQTSVSDNTIWIVAIFQVLCMDGFVRAVQLEHIQRFHGVRSLHSGWIGARSSSAVPILLVHTLAGEAVLHAWKQRQLENDEILLRGHEAEFEVNAAAVEVEAAHSRGRWRPSSRITTKRDIATMTLGAQLHVLESSNPRACCGASEALYLAPGDSCSVLQLSSFHGCAGKLESKEWSLPSWDPLYLRIATSQARFAHVALILALCETTHAVSKLSKIPLSVMTERIHQQSTRKSVQGFPEHPGQETAQNLFKEPYVPASVPRKTQRDLAQPKVENKAGGATFCCICSMARLVESPTDSEAHGKPCRLSGRTIPFRSQFSKATVDTLADLAVAAETQRCDRESSGRCRSEPTLPSAEQWKEILQIARSYEGVLSSVGSSVTELVHTCGENSSVDFRPAHALGNHGFRYLLDCELASNTIRKPRATQITTCNEVGKGVVKASFLPTSTAAWAALSNNKSELLRIVLERGSRWSDIRWHLVPLWLVDSEPLKRLGESTAKSEYIHSGKDPFTCALFYIALKRWTVLASLFNVAQHSTIARFLGQDFESERWRIAARKNAFVLRSKKKFRLSAGWFILAANYKEALTVLVKDEKDFALAVFIAALVQQFVIPSRTQSMGNGANESTANLSVWLYEEFLTDISAKDPWIEVIYFVTRGRWSEAFRACLRLHSEAKRRCASVEATPELSKAVGKRESHGLDVFSAETPEEGNGVCIDLHTRSFELLLAIEEELRQAGGKLAWTDTSLMNFLGFEVARKQNEIGMPTLALSTLHRVSQCDHNQDPARRVGTIFDSAQSVDCRNNEAGVSLRKIVNTLIWEWWASSHPWVCLDDHDRIIERGFKKKTTQELLATEETILWACLRRLLFFAKFSGVDFLKSLDEVWRLKNPSEDALLRHTLNLAALRMAWKDSLFCSAAPRGSDICAVEEQSQPWARLKSPISIGLEKRVQDTGQISLASTILSWSTEIALDLTHSFAQWMRSPKSRSEQADRHKPRRVLILVFKAHLLNESEANMICLDLTSKFLLVCSFLLAWFVEEAKEISFEMNNHLAEFLSLFGNTMSPNAASFLKRLQRLNGRRFRMLRSVGKHSLKCLLFESFWATNLLSFILTRASGYSLDKRAAHIRGIRPTGAELIMHCCTLCLSAIELFMKTQEQRLLGRFACERILQYLPCNNELDEKDDEFRAISDLVSEEDVSTKRKKVCTFRPSPDDSKASLRYQMINSYAIGCHDKEEVKTSATKNTIVCGCMDRSSLSDELVICRQNRVESMKVLNRRGRVQIKAGCRGEAFPGAYNAISQPASVLAHPFYSKFFIGGMEGDLSVWDFATSLGGRTWKPLQVYGRKAGERRPLRSISMEKCGQQLVAGHARGHVEVWTPDNAQLRKLLQFWCHREELHHLAFLEDSSSVFASSGTSRGGRRAVRLWDTLCSPLSAMVAEFPTFDNNISKIAYEESHQLLVGASTTGAISLFDIRQQRHLHTWKGAHDGPITDIVFVNEKSLMSAGLDGYLKTWSFPALNETMSIRPLRTSITERKKKTGISCILSHPNQQSVVVCDDEGHLVTVPITRTL